MSIEDIGVLYSKELQLAGEVQELTQQLEQARIHYQAHIDRMTEEVRTAEDRVMELTDRSAQARDSIVRLRDRLREVRQERYQAEARMAALEEEVRALRQDQRQYQAGFEAGVSFIVGMIFAEKYDPTSRGTSKDQA